MITINMSWDTTGWIFFYLVFEITEFSDKTADAVIIEQT